MESLLSKIKKLDNCEVLPPVGMPLIDRPIPSDMEEFYKLCGGVKLFSNKDYGIQIVAPREFVLANPVIVGELYEEDISSSWYIVAKGGSDEIISIDLDPTRVGRCYDSFYDTHAVAGSCAIVAGSFTELLEKLIENQGGYWYWLKDNFDHIGDAYD